MKLHRVEFPGTTFAPIELPDLASLPLQPDRAELAFVVRLPQRPVRDVSDRDRVG